MGYRSAQKQGALNIICINPEVCEIADAVIDGD